VDVSISVYVCASLSVCLCPFQCVCLSLCECVPLCMCMFQCVHKPSRLKSIDINRKLLRNMMRDDPPKIKSLATHLRAATQSLGNNGLDELEGKM